LLPNISGSVYCGADGGVNLRRRVVLHAGKDVAIEVERYPDARMTKAFLRRLGVNAICWKMCRVGVPQVV
jgi:hypothetical protein